MNSHKPTKHIDFTDLIVEEYDDYILINKPAYLSSLEDRNDAQNLLALAKKANEHYQICHRLDKETSGMIVFAKNQDAYRNFAMQLEKREVKKVYHAVVHGLHNFENLEIDKPIYTASNKSKIDYRSGRPSFTLVSSLERFKKHTLLKCLPITGRMHQIRVHLASTDAPIINDPLYGGDPAYLSHLKSKYNLKKWTDERPIIERVALHSAEIAFKDLNGNIIQANAPYPKDFSVLIKQLEKYK